MGIFSIIGLVLSALPGLINAIESVVGAVQGQGTMKKSAVMGAVGGIVDAIVSTPGNSATSAQKDAIMALASGATDALVTTYNAVGHFTGKPELVVDAGPDK